jgi:hypothetical protein
VTPELPRTHGRSSPGFQPLQSFSFSTLCPSDPPEHEARTRVLARRPKPATQRTDSPPRRVRPPCRKTTGSSLVGSTQLLTAGPRRLSTAKHSLSALGHPPQRTHAGSQGFAVEEKSTFSVEKVPSLGVSCLLADLVTSKASTTLAYRFTPELNTRLRMPPSGLGRRDPLPGRHVVVVSACRREPLAPFNGTTRASPMLE